MKKLIIFRFTVFYKTLFLLSVILAPSNILAQNFSAEKDEPIKIQRINTPVKLDGLSNEAAWEGIKSLPIVMRMPILVKNHQSLQQFYRL